METGFYHSRQAEAGQLVPGRYTVVGTAHGSGSPGGKSGAAAVAVEWARNDRRIRRVSRKRDRYGCTVHQS
jgi:hypothetical protein